MDYTRYIILSSDMRQAEYYFKRVKAILNPIVDHQSVHHLELTIGSTKLWFMSSVNYYTQAYIDNHDAKVMRDDKFEEKLMEYMKTVKDIKEIVRNDSK